ncbi:hypothetical protein A1E_00660 [Rickettsia canadensis str. McKiel]|uniref:Uncharacterized protein n=1 Tax=Rickettsia canadensis (strain McKiel) TaxID=293613 RepID=A8EXJ7_RICCK|nr:hypothetical protein A1E_00660 [Rickettsia canadensis str. McKiel]
MTKQGRNKNASLQHFIIFTGLQRSEQMRAIMI